eukprot:2020981-Pleurochrysis_carterae.AAC.2
MHTHTHAHTPGQRRVEKVRGSRIGCSMPVRVWVPLACSRALVPTAMGRHRLAECVASLSRTRQRAHHRPREKARHIDNHATKSAGIKQDPARPRSPAHANFSFVRPHQLHLRYGTHSRRESESRMRRAVILACGKK